MSGIPQRGTTATGVTGSATDTNVGGGVKQGISTGPPLKGYEGDVRGEGRQLGAAAGSSNAGGLGSVGAIPTSGGTSGVSGGGEDFSTATIPQRGTTATGITGSFTDVTSGKGSVGQAAPSGAPLEGFTGVTRDPRREPGASTQGGLGDLGRKQ